jgi:uncharacterized membrane protein
MGNTIIPFRYKSPEVFIFLYSKLYNDYYKMKKRYIFIIILFIIYTAVGLIYSNSQGFWHDEIYTLTFLKGISPYPFAGNTLENYLNIFQSNDCKNLLNSDNFINNIYVRIIHEGHAPLYFILLKLWAIIFGYSELALRSFSLFSGIISLIILFRFFQIFINNQFSLWILIILILFNPFLFYYFTEARMYSLAFLFSIISFKYWISYKEHKNFKSFDFLYFVLSTVSLFYTHYYGIFFFFTLLFYDIFKNGINLKLFHYFFPLLLFSPWFIMIVKQTQLLTHSWTEDSLNILNSFIEFDKGILRLFFLAKPESNILLPVFSLIFTLILFYYFDFKWRKKFLFICVFSFYFFQLFIFDSIMNQHSIVVPRYYIFILILFYLAISKFIDKAPKIIIISLSICYLSLASYQYYKIFNYSLMPKRMYKELANYIDLQHNVDNTIIVIEPDYLAFWGLSYYLKKDFKLISARFLNNIKTDKHLIYIDVMLGDKFSENKLNTEAQNNLKLKRFAGLYLYE